MNHREALRRAIECCEQYRHCIKESQRDWDDRVPFVMYVYRMFSGQRGGKGGTVEIDRVNVAIKKGVNCRKYIQIG